uniref:Inhibitor of growth protein n=1 Tax=Parastrongyloides trichosuri TaxID=131310 RepID=A0A0N4ZG64_PARTI
MQYLEDFLEMLESVPPEIRYITNQMRLHDVSPEESEALHKKIETFMEEKDSMSPEERDVIANEIRATQREHTNKATVRCDLAKKLRTIFDLYKSRFEEDLHNFKLELEAEAPGVTEAIEKKYNEQQKLSHETNNSRRSNGCGIENLALYYTGEDDQLIYNSDCEISRSSMGGQTPRHNSHGDLDIPPQLFDKLGLQNIRNRSSTFGTKIEDPDTTQNKRRRTITSTPNLNTPTTHMTDFTEPWFRDPSGAITPNFCMSPNTISNNKVTLGTYQETSHLSSNQVSSSYDLKDSNSKLGRQRRLTSRMQDVINDTNYIDTGRRRSNVYPPMQTAVMSTFLRNFNDRDQTPVSGTTASDEDEEESDEDDGEEENNGRLWCKCREKSYGLMVKCDNEDCQYRWFHGDCVGITPSNRPAENEKWLCSFCLQRIRNLK